MLIARQYKVVGKLVNYTNTTFIKGRDIYNGWIIAFEILDVMKRKGDRFIFKIDFAKKCTIGLIELFCGSSFSVWVSIIDRFDGFKDVYLVL